MFRGSRAMRRIIRLPQEARRKHGLRARRGRRTGARGHCGGAGAYTYAHHVAALSPDRHPHPRALRGLAAGSSRRPHVHPAGRRPCMRRTRAGGELPRRRRVLAACRLAFAHGAHERPRQAPRLAPHGHRLGVRCACGRAAHVPLGRLRLVSRRALRRRLLHHHDGRKPCRRRGRALACANRLARVPCHGGCPGHRNRDAVLRSGLCRRRRGRRPQ